MISRWNEFKTYAREEFIAHFPFTLIGVAAGALFVLAVVVSGSGLRFGEEEFHWTHVVHVFFSGAAGSAIFRSYRDSLWKGLPVAAASSILLCTLSDILIPYVGLQLAGYPGHLHLCLAEHPGRVIGAAFGGAAAGLLGARFFAHCNRPFHLLHILISTAASTLYLLSALPQVDARALAVITLTLFFALVIPCIAGDVAVPLLFVRIREPFLHEKVHHSDDHPHSH